MGLRLEHSVLACWTAIACLLVVRASNADDPYVGSVLDREESVVAPLYFAETRPLPTGSRLPESRWPEFAASRMRSERGSRSILFVARKPTCASTTTSYKLTPLGFSAELSTTPPAPLFEKPVPVEDLFTDRRNEESATIESEVPPVLKQDESDESDEDESKDSEDKKTSPATQRSSFAWIPGTDNQLGMLEWAWRDLSLYQKTIQDDGGRTHYFSVKDGFTARWLTGPDSTDLPPYLFSLFLDTAFGSQLTPNWSMETLISPSWNSDFANKGYKLFRLPWQTVQTLKVSDEYQLTLGLADLAREDIRLLPVVGVTYAPIDGSKQFDLIFPRPKMAWRLTHKTGGWNWACVSGELGGGSFNILRSDRQDDIVTLRDYRLIFGLETRAKRGHADRIEAGWIFGRSVQYQSNIGNYHPGDTAILRISTDY